MNLTVLLGKVKEPLVVKETSNGTQFGQFVIEVERYYQKEDGLRECDTFMVTVWRGLVDMATDLKKGDIVSVRAHLTQNNFVRDDGEVLYRTDLVAERIAQVA